MYLCHHAFPTNYCVLHNTVHLDIVRDKFLEVLKLSCCDDSRNRDKAVKSFSFLHGAICQKAGRESKGFGLVFMVCETSSPLTNAHAGSSGVGTKNEIHPLRWQRDQAMTRSNTLQWLLVIGVEPFRDGLKSYGTVHTAHSISRGSHVHSSFTHASTSQACCQYNRTACRQGSDQDGGGLV